MTDHANPAPDKDREGTPARWARAVYNQDSGELVILCSLCSSPITAPLSHKKRYCDSCFTLFVKQRR